MTGKFYRGTLILVALGSFASVPMLNAQPSPAGNVRDAIVDAKESVTHLTEAIEDGKAGHAHTALTHLNAVSTLPSSVGLYERVGEKTLPVSILKRSALSAQWSLSGRLTIQ